MIQNDTELRGVQDRILLFERMLAEARRTYAPSDYQVMAEGYFMEIDKLQAEIREYLRRQPEHIEAA